MKLHRPTRPQYPVGGHFVDASANRTPNVANALHGDRDVEDAAGDQRAALRERQRDRGVCPGPFRGPRRWPHADDTQMSLADALVEGDPWTLARLAARFVGTFERDPRPWYAQFHDLLQGNIRWRRVPTAAPAREPAERVRDARRAHRPPAGCQRGEAPARILEAHVPGKWSQPWERTSMACPACTPRYRRPPPAGQCAHCCAPVWPSWGTWTRWRRSQWRRRSGSSEVDQDLPDALVRNLAPGPYGRDSLGALDRWLRLWRRTRVGPAGRIRSGDGARRARAAGGGGRSGGRVARLRVRMAP